MNFCLSDSSLLWFGFNKVWKCLSSFCPLGMKVWMVLFYNWSTIPKAEYCNKFRGMDGSKTQKCPHFYQDKLNSLTTESLTHSSSLLAFCQCHEIWAINHITTWYWMCYLIFLTYVTKLSSYGWFSDFSKKKSLCIKFKE